MNAFVLTHATFFYGVVGVIFVILGSFSELNILPTIEMSSEYDAHYLASLLS